MTWISFAILSAIFAAFVAIFGKIGLKNIDSTLATTVRSVFMAGFLIIVSFALQKFKQIGSIDERSLLFIALSGIAGALSWLFYFFALKSGSASGVAALDRLSVVFIIILAALFLGESLTWRSGLAGILIATGAILMVVK